MRVPGAARSVLTVAGRGTTAPWRSGDRAARRSRTAVPARGSRKRGTPGTSARRTNRRRQARGIRRAPRRRTPGTSRRRAGARPKGTARWGAETNASEARHDHAAEIALLRRGVKRVVDLVQLVAPRDD